MHELGLWKLVALRGHPGEIRHTGSTAVIDLAVGSEDIVDGFTGRLLRLCLSRRTRVWAVKKRWSGDVYRRMASLWRWSVSFCWIAAVMPVSRRAARTSSTSVNPRTTLLDWPPSQSWPDSAARWGTCWAAWSTGRRLDSDQVLVDTFRSDSTYYAAPSCTAEVVFIGKLSKIAKGRCHWRVTRREGGEGWEVHPYTTGMNSGSIAF